MEYLIEQAVIEQTIPLWGMGIVSGFMTGTVLHLLSYGIFKAIRLVNINK